MRGHPTEGAGPGRQPASDIAHPQLFELDPWEQGVIASVPGVQPWQLPAMLGPAVERAYDFLWWCKCIRMSACKCPCSAAACTLAS